MPLTAPINIRSRLSGHDDLASNDIHLRTFKTYRLSPRDPFGQQYEGGCGRFLEDSPGLALCCVKH